MLKFKKRLRLLTEKHGGTIEYAEHDSLTIKFSTGSVHISSLSYALMHCDMQVSGASFPIRAPKKYCFDITDRLASHHLSQRLQDYKHGCLLELEDYISDEQGGPILRAFRKQLDEDPSIAHADFGGNRILAEYYHGVIILSDDLCTDATNVVEFSV